MTGASVATSWRPGREVGVPDFSAQRSYGILTN